MNPSIFVSIAKEPGLSTSERETIRYDDFVRKLLKPLPEQLNALHIAVGLAGELCEYLDAEEEHNIIEELGDIEFYLQAGLLHYNLTHAECTNYGVDISPYEVHMDFIRAIGNLTDLIKREYIYEKPRDLAELKLAFGYLMNCMVMAINQNKLSRAEILQANAIKLEKRYAELYYSDEAAIARADKSSPETP